ncbi:hypothetical protein SEMRO_699_G189400.1 [Seminavis robusta]|uniref:Uncharacterized protein n=1 Tax=Seminavis robusta TaxID=568900 RepID=A0A9N8E5Q2_9STRA|nr:hypothetical protein SEMRO_699_G189400.1 [Seminavis robusta]|eukprot:Sro699_g189400.1 n/a (328) ;mRNA; r:14554-15537
MIADAIQLLVRRLQGSGPEPSEDSVNGDLIAAAGAFEVVSKGMHQPKKSASCMHRHILTPENVNAIEARNLPSSDADAPIARNNHAVHYYNPNAKDSESLHPVDSYVILQARNVLSFLEVPEGQTPAECLRCLIPTINDLFREEATDNDLYKRWEYLYMTFRVDDSPASLAFLELLKTTRDSTLTNSGNRQERRGQVTANKEENNDEFDIALPKIFNTHGWHFWVRKEKTLDPQSFGSFPNNTNGVPVITRIAYYGGIKTRLQNLQKVGGPSRKGNTEALKSSGLEILRAQVGPSEVIGIGKVNGVKPKGHFILAYFTRYTPKSKPN